MSTGAHVPAPPAQRGMALVAALFMIIVVASFGAFALRIGANQQQTANLELLADRAFAAANSGLELGSRHASTGACVNANFVLNNFTVTVTCAQTPHLINGVPRQIYYLRAVARHGAYGTPDFIQRTLDRRVSDIPPPFGIW